MPTTAESTARTRAFARVIGPWLVIVPGIIAVRAPDMGTLTSGFFENPLIVWFAGAQLLFGGLLIIAFHQFWSSAAAIVISLFGLVPGTSRRGPPGRAATDRAWRGCIDEGVAACPGRLRRRRADRPLAHLCRLDRQARLIAGEEQSVSRRARLNYARALARIPDSLVL